MPGNIPNTEQLQVSGEKSHALPSRPQAQWAPEGTVRLESSRLILEMRAHVLSLPSNCTHPLHPVPSANTHSCHCAASSWQVAFLTISAAHLAWCSPASSFFCSDGGNYPPPPTTVQTLHLCLGSHPFCLANDLVFPFIPFSASAISPSLMDHFTA